MNTITIEIAQKALPDQKYSQSRVESLIGGGKTPLEILDLDIPAQDRVWLLTRQGVLPRRMQHEFACRCAEYVLPAWDMQYESDRRPAESVAGKRLWLAGQISDDELNRRRCAAYEAAKEVDPVYSPIAYAGSGAALQISSLAAIDASLAMAAFLADFTVAKARQVKILREIIETDLGGNR